jgi:hypothetical protein
MAYCFLLFEETHLPKADAALRLLGGANAAGAATARATMMNGRKRFMRR